MKIIVATALALILAGCSSSPEVMEGNARSVIIDARDQGRIDGSLTEADKYCAKYGRIAQYKGKLDEFQFAYDCLPAESGAPPLIKE